MLRLQVTTEVGSNRQVDASAHLTIDLTNEACIYLSAAFMCSAMKGFAEEEC